MSAGATPSPLGKPEELFMWLCGLITGCTYCTALRCRRSECPIWAESGECEANPGYMVGDKRRPGDCLVSCSRCDLLPVPAGTAAARRLKVEEGGAGSKASAGKH